MACAKHLTCVFNQGITAELPQGAPAGGVKSGRHRTKQPLLLSASVLALAVAMCALPSAPARAVQAACGDPADDPDFDPVGSGTGAFAVFCGDGATASGANAVAIGRDANANGAGATATGNVANANGAGATATGRLAHANGEAATATGRQAAAHGNVATATGALA